MRKYISKVREDVVSSYEASRAGNQRREVSLVIFLQVPSEAHQQIHSQEELVLSDGGRTFELDTGERIKSETEHRQRDRN